MLAKNIVALSLSLLAALFIHTFISGALLIFTLAQSLIFAAELSILSHLFGDVAGQSYAPMDGFMWFMINILNLPADYQGDPLASKEVQVRFAQIMIWGSIVLWAIDRAISAIYKKDLAVSYRIIFTIAAASILKSLIFGPIVAYLGMNHDNVDPTLGFVLPLINVIVTLFVLAPPLFLLHLLQKARRGISRA